MSFPSQESQHSSQQSYSQRQVSILMILCFDWKQQNWQFAKQQIANLRWIWPKKTNVVFFLNFLFCIGLLPMNNAVIFSDEQRRDSAIHIHVSILPRPFSHLGCHINILIHTWTFIYLNSNVSKELGLSQLGNFRRRKNKFHLATGITRKKTLKPDL